MQPGRIGGHDDVAERRAGADGRGACGLVDRDLVEVAEIDQEIIGAEDVVHRVAAADRLDPLAGAPGLVDEIDHLIDRARCFDLSRGEADVLERVQDLAVAVGHDASP